MASRIDDRPSEHETGEHVTLVSYNRPLTRSARRALKPYGIVHEEAVRDFGRWTVVTVRELPPAAIRAEHELRHEREPQHVYLTDTRERVTIYEDSVELLDGHQVPLSPAEAVEHATKHGWERIDGEADAPHGGGR